MDGGKSNSAIANELGIKQDTLRKAINQGRLTKPSTHPKTTSSSASNGATTKSERSKTDSEASSSSLGVACTRENERILASFGMLNGAPTAFESSYDVSMGSVLCSLPALAENGLFEHIDTCLKQLKGYYTTLHIIILLAYMALCRIKMVEQLQYYPPGELGKLLGLDRVPEVRCLRNKLTELSEDNAGEKWAGILSRYWMEKNPQCAGVLHIDGHVRVYHGNKTKLPRKYVSRERLCLRGTMDYWVNDALGQPYFVIEKPVDPGMLEVIRKDIVPRLLQDVPNQPSTQELEAEPYRHRMLLVFDREGYSPEFFKEMWQTYRIACITYHKYPKDTWEDDEFSDVQLTLANGEIVTMKLAERGTYIGLPKKGLWVREIRKKTETGRQISTITTAYGIEGLQVAGKLFSRWTQENFFRYAMKHLNIDLLCEHKTEGFTSAQKVVNPAWRELDRKRRSLTTKLSRVKVKYASLTLKDDADIKDIDKWEKAKGKIVISIEGLEEELLQVKKSIKATSKHIDWSELSEDDKFERLSSNRKHLIDTIKLVAYRAETAMVSIVREKLSRKDDARVLIQELCRSDADILPDSKNGILNVYAHAMANPRSNQAIEHLLSHLNESQFNYPGTTLRLVYHLRGGCRDND